MLVFVLGFFSDIFQTRDMFGGNYCTFQFFQICIAFTDDLDYCMLIYERRNMPLRSPIAILQYKHVALHIWLNTKVMKHM